MLWLFVGFFNGNFKSDYFAQVCRFEDWCKSCYLLINADKGKRLELHRLKKQVFHFLISLFKSVKASSF